MYLLVKTKDYQTKNKLQMAAWKFLISQNRQTFENMDAVKAAINEYRNKIVHLNRENMRCSALELKDFKPYDGGKDIVIHIENVIYLTFYGSVSETPNVELA
jgi:hypothetical protein